jgi:hypothetical protein
MHAKSNPAGAGAQPVSSNAGYVAELVTSISRNGVASGNEMVLGLCRELAADGRFVDIAQLLSAWCCTHRQAETTLCAQLPAIALHCYLAPLGVLAADQLHDWTMATPTWADVIVAHALHETKLPAAIEHTAASMRRHAQANQPS